jgi:hypothetical protein
MFTFKKTSGIVSSILIIGLVAFFIPWPSRVSAAVALIANTAAARGAFSGVTTEAIDTTGADFLIIGMVVDDGYSTTPTDSKGNTWTEAANSYSSTGVVRVRVWYSIPDTVGTNHTFSASGSVVGHILAAAFSGVDQSDPEDQQSGANGSGTTLQPGSITPTEDGALLWAHMGFSSDGLPVSIDSDYIEIDEAEFVSGESYGGQWAYQIQSTAAAINPTWTRTNSDILTGTQISFNAAGAPAEEPAPVQKQSEFWFKSDD